MKHIVGLEKHRNTNFTKFHEISRPEDHINDFKVIFTKFHVFPVFCLLTKTQRDCQITVLGRFMNFTFFPPEEMWISRLYAFYVSASEISRLALRASCMSWFWIQRCGFHGFMKLKFSQKFHEFHVLLSGPLWISPCLHGFACICEIHEFHGVLAHTRANFVKITSPLNFQAIFPCAIFRFMVLVTPRGCPLHCALWVWLAFRPISQS